jgi:hypothetical protein
VSGEDRDDLEDDHEDPGSFEYVYTHYMSDAERDQWDRDQQEAEEARAAEEEARRADLQRRWAAVGCDIFGTPFTSPSSAPEAEAADDFDLERE